MRCKTGAHTQTRTPCIQCAIASLVVYEIMKLEGAVAVVTGGARGIGKAITKSLLQNKAKVYFLDLDVNEGQNVQKEFKDEFGEGMATFLECDVTDKGKVEGILSKAAKENGHLDILCNNAGIGCEDDIEKLISINLTAMIHGTLLGVQYMNNGGCIVNISSIAGLLYVPSPKCAYSASKHGVVGFTRCYAKVAINSGVRLNCICPSLIDTDLTRDAMERDPDFKQYVDNLGMGSVDTVAEGFIQLLNDEDKVGEAMIITTQNEIKYHNFPEEMANSFS